MIRHLKAFLAALLALLLCIAPLAYAEPYAALPIGAQGKLVQEMQLRLAELGYLSGEDLKTENTYAGLTVQAIFRFQRDAGLLETGEADGETLALLYSEDAWLYSPISAAGDPMIWLPQTGEHYHDNKRCSGMIEPSRASIEEAKRQGYELCLLCYYTPEERLAQQ